LATRHLRGPLGQQRRRGSTERRSIGIESQPHCQARVSDAQSAYRYTRHGSDRTRQRSRPARQLKNPTAAAIALAANPLAGVALPPVPTRIVWGMADTIFSAAGADHLDRSAPASRGATSATARRRDRGRALAPATLTAMPELVVRTLLRTPTVAVRDVVCRGTCLHKGPEECASSLQLVFTYRGAYVRHLGSDPAVAEANQVVVFNPGEGYRISHPVRGGDASLVIVPDEEQLRELVPGALQRRGPVLGLDVHRLRIDPRAQALVALVRHGLRSGAAEPLEAESLALTLVRRAFGARTSHRAGSTAARRRLVDRAKLVLASDLSRRWTLAELGREVGASPVYLTTVFQQVEAVPLSRYQLRLRLARALDRLDRVEDLSALAFEVGFSSHSHFTAAFQRVYGRTPSAFRRQALRARSIRT
jgi:AraC family transcriptional regulator